MFSEFTGKGIKRQPLYTGNMQCKKTVESMMPSFLEFFEHFKKEPEYQEYRQRIWNDHCDVEWVSRRWFIETLDELRKLFDKEDIIDVYRAITVENFEWFKEELRDKHKTTTIDGNLLGLGIYWTWDELSAQSYWAKDKGIEVIVGARIPCIDIDFYGTIWANMVYFGRKEREIRLKEGKTIQIVSVFTGPTGTEPFLAWAYV